MEAHCAHSCHRYCARADCKAEASSRARMIKDGSSEAVYARDRLNDRHYTGRTKMITEIAQIDVKPGTEAEFENGVKQAVPLFKRAKGAAAWNCAARSRSQAATAYSSAGTRSKTTRWIFAAQRISRNGASWSHIASPRRRMWNTSPRWCGD